MKPASATRRGAKRSISAASAASKSSRPARPRWSTTCVAMPRAAAIARPSASARLLMTALTGIPASRSACMLLPRPEMRTTTKLEHHVGAIAVGFEQREHALVAVKVQRTESDERAAAPQHALHAKGHHHTAVVHHALGHHRLVRRDCGVPRDELLAQSPDRRQVTLEVRLHRALGELEKLVAMGETMLEERDLRIHRELVERENLLLDAFDLMQRQAARARQLEQLAVERRALLRAPGIAQVEQHPPGLELVHHLAGKADGRQVLHRALEVLRADFLGERLPVEEHRRLEEAAARIRVGDEFEHQARRRVEALPHHRRQLGKPRIGHVDRAVDVARRNALLRDAPEQPAAESLLDRGMNAKPHDRDTSEDELATLHRPGPIMASARTQRSKSAALT